MSDEQVKRYSTSANSLYQGTRLGALSVVMSSDHDRIVSALRAENEALMGTLDQINTMACYASEENTSLRPQALLEIGKLARAALTATEKEADDPQKKERRRYPPQVYV